MACKKVRRERGDLPVYAADGSMRIVNYVTPATAALYEQREVWRREYDKTNGALIGFRVIAVEMQRVDAGVRSMPVAVAITRGQMDLNVERSRTAGLSEVERMKLMAAGRPPEDRVERVQAKVRMWPRVGAAKGDVLRAWPLRSN